jgi:hypothetical protein
MIAGWEAEEKKPLYAFGCGYKLIKLIWKTAWRFL